MRRGPHTRHGVFMGRGKRPRRKCLMRKQWAPKRGTHVNVYEAERNRKEVSDG